MSGILDKFHVEHGVHGSRVLARSSQLTNYLTDEQSIDTMVTMLKDDLDACAREMKRLTAIERRASLGTRFLNEMASPGPSRVTCTPSLSRVAARSASPDSGGAPSRGPSALTVATSAEDEPSSS